MFTPEVMAVGPDCREGKHRACDGRGFDPVGDRIIRCSCDCHDALDLSIDPHSIQGRMIPEGGWD